MFARGDISQILSVPDQEPDWEWNSDDEEENPIEPQRARPTYHTRDFLFRKWKEFQDDNPILFEDHDSMTVLRMKRFIHNYAVKSMFSSKGVRRKGATVETLVHYVWVLNRAHHLRYGNGLTAEEVKGVQEYCRQKLQQKLLLPESSQRKSIATHTDLSVLLSYLWAEDKQKYKHERMRLQVSFFLKLILYTAARPGAVVVSSAYVGTNDALKYGDAKLCLLEDPSDPNGIPKATLTLRFNYLKGQRLKNNNYIEITVKQDRTSPSECCINDFYALADADGAWKYFADSEAVHKYRLMPGRKDFQVLFKDSVLSTPFLRQNNRRGAISKTQGWNCAAAAYYLAALGRRAGFRNKIRPYDLRRGAANILQMIATESELCQQMGHNSAKVFQKYLSKHCRWDLQGHFSGKGSEAWHIDQLNSMSIGRLPDIPIPCRVDLGPSNEILISKKKRDLLMKRAESLIGGKIRVRILERPNLYRAWVRDLVNKGLDTSLRPQLDELHKLAVFTKGFREHELRQKKEKWRTNYFEKQNAIDAAYRPNDGHTKSSEIEKIKPRDELSTLLFPEEGYVATTEDLVKLSRLLREICEEGPVWDEEIDEMKDNDREDSPDFHSFEDEEDDWNGWDESTTESTLPQDHFKQGAQGHLAKAAEH